MEPASRGPESEERRRLIESHLPLVRAIAGRYAGRGETFDDLVQAGSVALIRAADRFDSGRGVAFASFASPAVEGEIRRHLGDRVPLMRIPRELQRMTGRLRRCRDQLSATLGRSPTVPELAAALAVQEADIVRALEAERARESISLEGTESEVVAAAPEFLADTEARILLERGVGVLEDRERRIVFLRFHADMTEREIARAVGISQPQVSRLLAASLDKLRAQFEETRADITSERAISPGAAPAKGLDTPPERASARADRQKLRARAKPRIDGVGAARQKADIGRLLELPYHLLVRAERENERVWWTATVEELPGCEAHGANPNQAAERVRGAMEAWFREALASRREIPMPNEDAAKRRSPTSYSGRFLVRMPSELHEALALAAEHDHVSLNRFVTDVLSEAVGRPATEKSSAGEPVGALTTPPSSPPNGRGLRVALAANLVVVVIAGVLALALLVIAITGHGV